MFLQALELWMGHPEAELQRSDSIFGLPSSYVTVSEGQNELCPEIPQEHQDISCVTILQGAHVVHHTE